MSKVGGGGDAPEVCCVGGLRRRLLHRFAGALPLIYNSYIYYALTYVGLISLEHRSFAPQLCSSFPEHHHHLEL